MWKKLHQKIGLLVCLFFLVAGLPMTARAETLPCRTAKAVGSYLDPTAGTTEDVGGQGNEALGQSMVSNVVDSVALIEDAPAGGYYVSLRFHLMENISNVDFSVKVPGADEWKNVSAEQTDAQGEQADFRFPMETEDSVIRTECYVEAMGRDVVFYVTLSDFEAGNQGGFVQMENDGKDVLNGVTGLTIGGGSVGTSGEKGAVLSSASSGSGDPQQLNLGTSVWVMLFVTIFCADVLAGIVLFGISSWISRTSRERRSWDEREDEEREADLEFPDLSEADWEDMKDDGKE